MVEKTSEAKPRSSRPQELIAGAALIGVVICIALIATARHGAAGRITGAPSQSGYRDDTHRTLNSGAAVLRLTGNYRLSRYLYDRPPDGRATALDARSAIFNVSNSKNANPTSRMPCSQGASPINPYPLSIYGDDRTALVGALIRGQIPQSSDWQQTYCNSAAIIFKSAADGVVDGVRITEAWDAVRISSASPNLTVRNSWISNVRDDVLENDYLFPAVIQDTLVDGAFQGISVRPGSSSRIADRSRNVVTVTGVLLRLREYPYKGEMRVGALSKTDPRSPRLRIMHSIVAIDCRRCANWSGSWSNTWSKIAESSNNQLLWLSDVPIPSAFPKPPSSFTVVRGQAARDIWARAKTNWINCHPKVVRQASDPRSNPAACRSGTWGGYTG